VSATRHVRATDGPLALMGSHPLSRARWLRHVHLVADGLRQQGLGLPVIVGAEKGGQFAEQGMRSTTPDRGRTS